MKYPTPISYVFKICQEKEMYLNIILCVEYLYSFTAATFTLLQHYFHTKIGWLNSQ